MSRDQDQDFYQGPRDQEKDFHKPNSSDLEVQDLGLEITRLHQDEVLVGRIHIRLMVPLVEDHSLALNNPSASLCSQGYWSETVYRRLSSTGTYIVCSIGRICSFLIHCFTLRCVTSGHVTYRHKQLGHTHTHSNEGLTEQWRTSPWQRNNSDVDDYNENVTVVYINFLDVSIFVVYYLFLRIRHMY